MTEHILSLSYGKDSLACLGAIEQLGWPLDRIVHAEVWATDTIPADLPPMVEFKKKADAIIKERYGIEVEHVCAMRNGEKLTYEKLFYHVPKRKPNAKIGGGQGFPTVGMPWCNSGLKRAALRMALRPGRLVQASQNTRGTCMASRCFCGVGARSSNRAAGTSAQLGFSNHTGGVVSRPQKKAFSQSALTRGAKTNIVQYIGIAADEPKRFHNLVEGKKLSPLVEAGWTEPMCREWCEKNDLLSPIYTDSARGGCWFCHNQGINQLRLLRKNYPEYWAMMLKWDNDSPVTFHPDGHTIHDFDRRFQMEDDGILIPGSVFRWKMINQLSVFDYIKEGETDGVR